MPKREDWLPYGITERAIALHAIANGAENYGLVVGLSQAQVDRIRAIADEYAFAARVYELNKTNIKALRSWRNDVMSSEGPIKSVNERPMFDNSPMPVGTQRGLIKEIRKYVRVMKASSGFTDVIGTSMSLFPPNHVKQPLREVKPQLKVKAVDGYRLTIACEKQGMDALRVEYRRKGEENWVTVAFLTTLPETFYIQPAVMGVPESGQIRAIFIKKNKVVGEYSNMPPVTLFAS